MNEPAATPAIPATHSSRPRPHPLACALAAVLVVSALPLHAQEASSNDDQTGSKPTELGKVIIKGTREIKDVTGGAFGVVSKLNTPFSISAVPSEALQDKQPPSVYEAFAGDASVTRQAGGAYTGWGSFISVRGIPISSTDGSQKLNGVPITTWGLSLPMEVMDQIQLMKGASGFMYGFTSPGGAVNYVTKKPVEGSLLSVDFGWTSDNLLKEHVDIGRGATDGSGLGFRLNAVNENGTTPTGTDVKRQSIALSTTANLTDAITWSFDSIYLKSEFDKPAPMIYVSAYNQAKLPSADDVVRNPQANEAYDNPRFLYVGTGFNWKFAPGWNADLRYTHSRTDQIYSKGYLNLLDASGRYQDRVFESRTTYDNDDAQLLVSGEVDVLGTSNKLVFGATVIRQQEDRGLSHQYPGFVSYGYRNLYTSTAFDYTPIDVKNQRMFPNNGNEQKAFFVSDTIEFTPNWLAIVGVRFTHYQQHQNLYTFASATDFSKTRIDLSTDETTPTLALMYKPQADTTFYASYSEALEPGNSVQQVYANAGQLTDPNTSKQWEIGYKQDGRTVRATAAAFRVDRGTGYANEANYWVQSGISRYQGLDASIDVKLTDDLAVGASAVWLDKADYLNASSPWLLDKKVPGAFDYSGAVHVDYALSSIEGLSFSGQARYTGRTVAYENAGRQLTIETPSYTLVDVSAKYQQLVGAHALTYRAGVNNLFDKSYWIGGSATYMFLGDPRTFFASVTLDF
ncbi:TonB-dependent receptor [Pseudoxanthomonas sp. JBR18]|uniref:TonB-dependent siderophore receptor n=1 Tax=Pseudoxanthomonas sp. JBR18 TaxID=2969308 RepID=UPI0023054A27|nr:TonB-dependent receptor [Pseudoxanthomonas sp. JBR18]WCE06028.1 TonB-dependent receptor [Pseudoxanthomonas sp. JBR18]